MSPRIGKKGSMLAAMCIVYYKTQTSEEWQRIEKSSLHEGTRIIVFLVVLGLVPVRVS